MHQQCRLQSQRGTKLMDLLLGIALSSHIEFAGDYNRYHPQVRYEGEDRAVGAYYNSEENLSVYASYLYDAGPITAEFGIVTGYEALETLQPFGRLYHTMPSGTRLFYSPGGELQSDGTITKGHIFGIEFLIKLN